ncbi:MAG: YkgJ family cysteine cluster protein [Deltaproteobacteria bacterium]|nr:YkgJ family cysteine cluster protein [Deltaproteobacteria bacterium]
MIKCNYTLPEVGEVSRTHCIRCGTCCTKGGPTLHDEDAVLFSNGVLNKADVYTLRKGEVVRNIDDTLTVIEQEMIKIKGQGESWSCMFYDDDENACKIYQNRPAECRALQCWALKGLKEVMARLCLQRKDLINPGDGVLRIIEAHEEKCGYAMLDLAVRRLEGADPEKAVEDILDLLRYDDHLRPFLAEKLKMDPDVMDFFFGRPLKTTIRMHGLCVKEEGDGFLLTKA